MKYIVKIEDNFLDQNVFDELQTLMMNESFAWYYRSKYYAKLIGDPSYIDLKEEDVLDQFQFIHTFYDVGIPQSPHMGTLQCFVDLLQPVSILRIRANLLTRLPTLIKNPFHSDIENILEEKQKQWTTSIFYVNTNDGYTEFEDGTKVDSVANRMLTFPANMKHTGTTCTNQQIRIIINFNYFK
jgi:hypothetical protein